MMLPFYRCTAFQAPTSEQLRHLSEVADESVAQLLTICQRSLTSTLDESHDTPHRYDALSINKRAFKKEIGVMTTASVIHNRICRHVFVACPLTAISTKPKSVLATCWPERNRQRMSRNRPSQTAATGHGLNVERTDPTECRILDLTAAARLHEANRPTGEARGRRPKVERRQA